MDSSRLTSGDVIVGVGAVVLVVALFLPWYAVSVEVAGFSKSDTGTGREVLGSIDLVLFLISAAAMAIVAARAVGALPGERSARLTMLTLGALAVLLVLYRIVDIPTSGHVPEDVQLSRKLGIFIALLGAAAVAYGGSRLPKGRRRPEGRAAVGGLELRGGRSARGSNRAGSVS